MSQTIYFGTYTKKRIQKEFTRHNLTLKQGH